MIKGIIENRLHRVMMQPLEKMVKFNMDHILDDYVTIVFNAHTLIPVLRAGFGITLSSRYKP